MKTFLSLLLSITVFSCVMIPNGYKQIDNISKIYKRYDDFKNITYYWHESSFSTAYTCQTPLYLYISKGKEKVLCARFLYVGANWIFFDQIIIKDNSGNTLTFNVKSYDKTTDVTSRGTIRESIDISLFEIDGFIDNKFEKLTEIIHNGGIKIRLSGKYYKDYEISSEIIQIYRNMISLYNSL